LSTGRTIAVLLLVAGASLYVVAWFLPRLSLYYYHPYSSVVIGLLLASGILIVVGLFVLGGLLPPQTLRKGVERKKGVWKSVSSNARDQAAKYGRYLARLEDLKQRGEIGDKAYQELGAEYMQKLRQSLEAESL